MESERKRARLVASVWLSCIFPQRWIFPLRFELHHSLATVPESELPEIAREYLVVLLDSGYNRQPALKRYCCLSAR